MAMMHKMPGSLRYTTDGTEPTMSSPLCTDKIIINKPCILKVKSVSTKYSNIPTVTTIFAKGEFMNALQTVGNGKKPKAAPITKEMLFHKE
jgi:hypothetical protein